MSDASSHRSANSSELANILADQSRRWGAGDRVPAERIILDAHFVLSDEQTLDVIYNEVTLREAAGETPDVEEYVARFPTLSQAIRDQFDVHRALDSVDFRESLSAEGAASIIESRRSPFPTPASGSGTPGSTGRRDDDTPPAIDRYQIISKIGHGGFGNVYLADQLRPIRRKVALKVIRRGMDSQQVVSRFDVERQTMAMMDHAGVARVFDAGVTDDGRPYFVMEYVPGEPITTFCDTHALGLESRLRLFQKVCDAVQYAHQKGVIHRDLKPSNVLVQSEGLSEPEPKVIDFGIAKATMPLATHARNPLSPESLHTTTGEMMGTPEYMSPEQAGADAIDIDTRTDIYSLGILLYELLIGTLPIEPSKLRSGSMLDIQRRIRDVAMPRPSTRLNTVSQAVQEKIAERRRTTVDALRRRLRRELEWIPLKAMHKDRDQRYTSASDLSADVENYLNGRPLAAGPDRATYRLRKFVSKYRLRLSAAAIVLITFVSLTGWYVQRLRIERNEKQLALDESQRQKAEAQRQEKEADEQSATARAVLDFQQSIITAADPQRLMGEHVTVLDANRAAIKQLDQGLMKDRPAIEAAVRQSIGTTLMQLSRFDEAEPQLRKALELARGIYPPGHLALAVPLTQLAAVLQATGRSTVAEPLVREAMAIEQAAVDRKALSPFDTRVWQTKGVLDQVLRSFGQYDEANRGSAALLKATVSKQPTTAGMTPEYARNWVKMTALLARVAKPKSEADAEAIGREMLSLARELYPAPDPRLAGMIVTLGNLLCSRGKFAEGEERYREALALRQKMLPAMHVDIAAVQVTLGLLLEQQDRYGEAELFFDDALKIYREKLPPFHASTRNAEFHHGWCIEKQGRLSEAQAIYFQALAELRAKGVQPGNVELPSTLDNVVSFLIRQKRWDEAKPYAAEAYETAKRAEAAGVARGYPRLVAYTQTRYGLTLFRSTAPAKADEEAAERLLSGALEPLATLGDDARSMRIAALKALVELAAIREGNDEGADTLRYKDQLHTLEREAATRNAATTRSATSPTTNSPTSIPSTMPATTSMQTSAAQ